MKFYGIKSRGKFWVHRVADIDTVTHEGVVDEGRLLYNYADERLYAGTESEWLKVTTRYDIFESGSKILFSSFPLPDNWTIDTTYDDKMVLATSTMASVFTSGGTWMISGLQADGAHTHGGRTGGPTNNSSKIGRSDLYAYSSTTNHTHPITSDGEHQHTIDGSWRPSYIISVVATYS
jgi:hypothetical protein